MTPDRLSDRRMDRQTVLFSRYGIAWHLQYPDILLLQRTVKIMMR